MSKLIELYGLMDPKRLLEVGKKTALDPGARRGVKEPVS